MRVPVVLFCIVTQVWTVNANVEKTIFLGPSPVTLPDVRPGLDDLHLRVLAPLDPIVPTQLAVQFPHKSLPRGLESWYLLRQLQAGRRYEVRVCWPATQPTDFWLDTFTIAHVFDTPNLLQSLAQYSESREPGQADIQAGTRLEPGDSVESLLFLRVQAAASYYSTNRTLMNHPLPVDVDIILDPFLLNVLPQSLVPIAIYITLVAIGAWFVSGYIYHWLLAAATEPQRKPRTD